MIKIYKSKLIGYSIPYHKFGLDIYKGRVNIYLNRSIYTIYTNDNSKRGSND